MGDDCICLQLTSNLKQNRLIVSNNDLSNGSLKKDSLVVVPKNFTLHKSILIKYLATIKEEKLFEIKKIFCEVQNNYNKGKK